jgi:uncharacterized protein YndB with AHSA1/START domain
VEVRSERRFQFDAAPPALWTALGSVDDYPRWWPWLRRFDARALAPGEEWRCTVKPPLPYVVRFTIRFDRVEAQRRIEATVRGDIEGPAQLLIEPSGAGSAVTLTSSLRPTNTFLKAAAIVGRPLVRYGHDWVLDIGAGQFASRAL